MSLNQCFWMVVWWTLESCSAHDMTSKVHLYMKMKWKLIILKGINEHLERHSPKGSEKRDEWKRMKGEKEYVSLRNCWPFYIVRINVHAFGNKMSRFRFRLILLYTLYSSLLSIDPHLDSHAEYKQLQCIWGLKNLYAISCTNTRTTSMNNNKKLFYLEIEWRRKNKCLWTKP